MFERIKEEEEEEKSSVRKERKKERKFKIRGTTYAERDRQSTRLLRSCVSLCVVYCPDCRNGVRKMDKRVMRESEIYGGTFKGLVQGDGSMKNTLKL